MYYTIYKITNKINGRIYIGLHKTEDLDDGYMGSGKTLKIHQKKFGLENFTKEILFVYDNPEDMYAKEAELVNEEFVSRKDTYNLKEGGEGGWDHAKGMVTVRDKDNNWFNVSNLDPRYLSKELIHILDEMRIVKDKNGNYISIPINDPRYLSGELKHNWYGKKHTKVSKDRISKSLLGRKSSFKGRKHSDETKKLMSEKAKERIGSMNSQYGTIWIHNVELKQNKKIKKNDPIPKGWEKGRKMKF